ncbi:FAD NAD(P)-binding oxidoreductase family isoform 1 [Chlorella sorokiniana]|uniref:FAD NAD(P)-binding oxidoreductase family isoform 1 n=1 Tax=Chlorella sorokiniana TaxID=3076 RepID=A0A2P6TU27_CHLSO|nr:FAD NAD(P)-binding oxidoreductase family isoform 1 [Chlorella sorokiniana]|eukprot:PRW57559.1 FAD NAD(P)-binding oxidoreductase family isoform 1 [Chlorella sorokiniana]
MSQPRRVAVIGGGIAGNAAALALARKNISCTLFDMGRSLGGRVASRQLEQQGQPLSFDHGAQQVTAIGADFQAQLAEWQAAGVVAEWRGRHGEIAGGAFRPRPEQPGSGSGGSGSGFCGSLTGLPLYVGVPNNNAIAQHMAGQLQAHPNAQLQSGVAVQAVERVGGGCGCGSGGSKWQLRGSRRGRAAAAEPEPVEQQTDLGLFDAIVLADAMPLLPGSAGHVAGIEAASTSLAQLARSVQAVAPEPCFALMVAFREPLPDVPFDSASVAGDASSSSSSGDSSGGSRAAFQWVACNSSKPGRPQLSGGAPQCWVALTTAQRAKQILERRPLSTADGRFNPQTEQYRAEVAAELLADFRALMQPFVQGDLPEPLYTHAQRWGRAFATQPLGAEMLFLPAQRLVLCGDVCTGSSVEAAWRSGRAAGNATADMLLADAAA